MRKIVLFSLITIISSAMVTKTNAMEPWQTIFQNADAPKFSGYGNCDPGHTLTLSENASWDDYIKAKRDVILLQNIGLNVAHSCRQEKVRYPQTHQGSISYCDTLLTEIEKTYIHAIIQREELAPRRYTKPEHQAIYQNFIKNLHESSQK